MNEEEATMPMPEMELTSTEFTGVKEYVPSAGDILKNYEVTIKPLDSGATVRVGCKTIAFTTLEDALENVNFYFKDPQTSYKHWMKEFNK
jgi:hypothetical protein